MKNKILKAVLIFGLLGALTISASAQTTNSAPSVQNGLQEIADAISQSTNWAVAPFYGRATTGNKSAAGVIAVWNFNDNVGVIGGYDRLWSSGQASQANMVSGGLKLQVSIHPLAFTGLAALTNIVATPYVASLVATPTGGTSNNGGLAAINRAGLELEIMQWKGLELHAGIDYGNRTGAGYYNGNYVDFNVAISRGF